MQKIDSIYTMPSNSLEQQLDEAYRELALYEETMAKTLELGNSISKDYFSEDTYTFTYNEVKRELDSVKNRISVLEQEIASRNIEYEEDHAI